MDKKIRSVDCNQDFIFTKGEEEFFEEKGYSEPIRCKDSFEITENSIHRSRVGQQCKMMHVLSQEGKDFKSIFQMMINKRRFVREGIHTPYSEQKSTR